MRKENLIIVILILCSLLANGQVWILPPQDADSLSITKIEIEFDKITKNVNIRKSTYDRLSIFHSHYNYQITINEIDTVLLTPNKDESQLDLRFLLCDGKEFNVTDPNTNKAKRTYFADNNKLRLGYWLANDDAYSKLATIAKELNQTIPAKEKCNEIRDLKKYNGHHYQVGVGDGSVYFKGVEFPVFNGSNSILSRQSRTEEYISNCLPNIDESIVFKLTLIIDSNGEVQNAEISNDCPERLREEILNCTKKMKWIPANNSTKKVRSKIQLLIGLNTNDKFEAWENISKSIQKNNHLGSRNGKILKQNLGSKNNEPEHIFNLVEEMPKLVDENALEKITNQLAAINPSKSISMIIRLVVEKNGSVSDVIVLRSNIGDLDEQTKSLILDNIKYSPGKQRGKPVRVQVIEKLNSK